MSANAKSRISSNRSEKSTVQSVRQHLLVSVAEGISFGIHNIPDSNVAPQTVTGELSVELGGETKSMRCRDHEGDQMRHLRGRKEEDRSGTG